MENICNRIKEIINSKEVTTARFAEIIGVKQSTLSHTLNGRNKPSLDIVMSISTTFPEISMDWLTKGKGQMFNDGSLSDESNVLVSSTDSFDQREMGIENPFSPDLSVRQEKSASELNEKDESTNPWDVALYAKPPYTNEFESLPPTHFIPSDACSIPKSQIKKRKITEVRIFFDDNTFESFLPNILGDIVK